MDTGQIMKTALKLAHFKSIPLDSEIHVKGRRIKKVLVAIDVGVGELLLARNLGCDAVIAHHPAGGNAQLEGYRVFHRHVDQLQEVGVPAEVAEEAVKPKLRQLELQHHPSNYDQTPNVARRLRMPLLSIHSPCDEMGRQIMMKVLKDLDNDSKVAEVISKLRRLPEFRKARSKVEVRVGSLNNRAGKVVISHGAYTNGGYDVARAYFRNGIGTVAYIHIAEADLTRLSMEGSGNLIVTGHIASDWIGLNRLLEELEERGIEATPTTDLH